LHIKHKTHHQPHQAWHHQQLKDDENCCSPQFTAHVITRQGSAERKNCTWHRKFAEQPQRGFKGSIK
jgi:hypothetical protein